MEITEAIIIKHEAHNFSLPSLPLLREQVGGKTLILASKLL